MCLNVEKAEKVQQSTQRQKAALSVWESMQILFKNRTEMHWDIEIFSLLAAFSYYTSQAALCSQRNGMDIHLFI